MKTLCLIAALFALLPCFGLAQAPVAPVRPVSDTYFGQTVVDPYRWMEDGKSDGEFQSWLKGQNDAARTVLAALPQRDTLRAEIAKLDNAGTSVSYVQYANGRWFYLKGRPGDPVPRLYVRVGLKGAEQLLVDPAGRSAAAGSHAAIDYYTPSWDGKLVAYGVSSGGSENSVLRVRSAVTGKDGPEAISRAQYGGIAWALDSKTFYYIRLQKLAAGANPAGRYENSRTYQHALGADPETDPAVLGAGLSTRLPLLPPDVPSLQFSPASPYAFAVIQHGVRHELSVFTAPRAALDGPRTPWVKICDEADGVTAFDAHGGTAYLLSHKNASRFEVVAVGLAHPDFAHARVAIPAGRAVLTGLGAAADALYVTATDGGLGQVRRLAYAGGPARILPLPYPGAVSPYGLVVNARRPGAVFSESGWTHSSLFYAYDPQTKQVADTGLKPASPVSFAGIDTQEVFTPGLDGTPIPLSLLFKKGLKRDGTHPALVAGYGAYGYSAFDPGLDPTRRAWLDRGGVLAFAHIRGGGEYGEDWHRAGQIGTKHNTWEDFIACGLYLIRHRYTSPAHLAGEGASAGGITVGRAMTERPGLFRAIVAHAGALNQLRAELTPNGPPNIPEFGSFQTAAGFQALYAMDAYSHLEAGVRYPAVLLTTGINDPRVSPSEPAKFAARLQAGATSARPVLLRVDFDAGHGNGSTKSQREDELADEYAFLFQQLTPAPRLNRVH